MRILLTNDDGIYAPGLAAMERALRRLGDVYVVAPSREQSGVAHSITFLTPLLAKRVFVDDKPWGWTVDGSPADCVKLGVSTILSDRPDLIVSGINGGLNAGINVLYSGTVAAAVEGAFYGIVSVAVSLEYSENSPFDRASDLAAGVIEKILQNDKSPRLYNLNLPLRAVESTKPEVCVVPMDVSQYWETFEKRTDPMGRSYYWLTGRPDPRQPNPVPSNCLTDMTALERGLITLTPLNYNLTDNERLPVLGTWDLTPSIPNGRSAKALEHTGPKVRVSR
ncbi:MAG: 5'/3'-nucleotidase SurE [Planctomycetaceae bacterium]|jgi:5'-nucleotidase|nr:5'/3'-nucleotidase SurE [Planctomycetaceae bacterium]